VKNKQEFVIDKWILIPAVLLMLTGLLMVASSSMVISDQDYGQPFHYLVRQSIYYALGIVMVVFAAKIPLDVWYKHSRNLMLLGLLMLILVLIPGIGKTVNGSRRWVNLGIVTLQVSEIVKLFAIVYLAGYLNRFKSKDVKDLRMFIVPMVILALMSVLLLLEPDFGSVSVMTATFLGLLFLAEVRLFPFIVLFVVIAGLLALLAISSPYRLERLIGFSNPWSNPYGSGYQLTQSLIAFGRGGIFGVGLGNSMQKLFYLPEAHTDFIFAVLGEELGLVGELALILLYSVLIGRMFFVGYKKIEQNSMFVGYLLYGLAICLSVQCMINIGVNIGLLPTKGLTLPFISYGGSSILVNCFIVGILLRATQLNEI